jgi:hypothetical protein
MYVKLLSLISQVVFYELDVGVDIKVANQQRKLIFPKNLSLAEQASRLFERTLYINQKPDIESDIESDIPGRTGRTDLEQTWKPVGQTDSRPDSRAAVVTESLNFQPIHFVLTTTWVILGGLIQSYALLKNVKKQVDSMIRQTQNG